MASLVILSNIIATVSAGADGQALSDVMISVVCPNGYMAIGGIPNVDASWTMQSQGPVPWNQTRSRVWGMVLGTGSVPVPQTGHYAICVQIPE